VRRWALRWQLTLAFTGALALVIGGLVVLTYARVTSELDGAIFDGLQARSSTLSTLAQTQDPAQAGAQLEALLAAQVKAEVELALARPRPVTELHAAMVSVAEETERLVALAEDLLVLSRSDQTNLPIKPAPTDAADLLTSVRHRFEPRAARQGRAITLTVEGEIGSLDADAIRLEQALSNLIENALRYGDGPIELRAERTGESVSLHVRDSGRGFPDDFLDKAFERFSRADEARARGGSGLGLAIVRTIAEAHGGHAAAENRSEGGADVSITLPVCGALTPEALVSR
jgi:two-component system, OmpR family, sensor kinase